MAVDNTALNNSSFHNNKNLKPIGIPVNFEQWMLVEIYKCMNDPVYFMKNYIKIVHVDHGVIPFDLYDYQVDLVENYLEKERFVVIKCPRQVGKSLTTGAYALWNVLFRPSITIAVLAQKADKARDYLRTVKAMYEYIPKWMQQGLVEWNKGSIELENGSRIVAESTGPNAVRGYSASMIIMDEFAHVPNNVAKDFFFSVYPTISSGKTTKVFIISTPKGIGNMFHKFWKDAEEGRNEYKPFSIVWQDVPGRDAAWERNERQQLGDRGFAQEHETAFLGSSDTLIDANKLESMTWTDALKEVEDIRIFKEPIEGASYVLTVDTSEGGGKDYHAISVFDVSKAPYEQVAVYRQNDISHLMLPEIIQKIALKYNGAYVLIEQNSTGTEVSNVLYYDLSYTNVFKIVSKGRKGQTLTLSYGGKNFQLGLKTTTSSKKAGCASLKALIENDGLIIHDIITINELMSFVFNGKSYAAQGDMNDDMCMTLVLFAWATNQDYFKDLVHSGLRSDVMKQAIENMQTTLTPLHHFDGTKEDDESSFVDANGDRWFSADQKEDGDYFFF